MASWLPRLGARPAAAAPPSRNSAHFETPAPGFSLAAEAVARPVAPGASAGARNGRATGRSTCGWHALPGPSTLPLCALLLGAVMFLATRVHLDCASSLGACATTREPWLHSTPPEGATLGLNLTVRLSLPANVPAERAAPSAAAALGAQAPSTAALPTKAPTPEGCGRGSLGNYSGGEQEAPYLARRLPPWVPQEGKYLVSTCHYGRSTNRLNCMQRGLVLAALMNRTYVLVKPDICHLPEMEERDEMPLLVDERHLEVCLAGGPGAEQHSQPPAPAQEAQDQPPLAAAPKTSAALESTARIGMDQNRSWGAPCWRQLQAGRRYSGGEQPCVRKELRWTRRLLEAQPSRLAPVNPFSLENSGSESTVHTPAGPVRAGTIPEHLDPSAVPDMVDGRRVVTLDEILEAYNVETLRVDRLFCEQPLCTPRKCVADYKLAFPPPETQHRVRGQFSAEDVIVWGQAVNHVNVLALGDLFYTTVNEHPVTGFNPLAPLFGSTCGNLFQPVPTIMEETEQFIRAYLQRPFAALHLRRTDFQHYCKGTAQAEKNQCPYYSLRQIAHCMWEDLRGSGITKLFVASDAPNWEIVTLRVLLRARGIRMVIRRSTPLQPLRSALLEKQISAQADRFFFQVQSSFSNHIRSLRRGMGAPECMDQPVCATRPMDFIPRR